MSYPIEIENQKETKILETVIGRHEKVIENQKQRINKIKELKELETTRKELEELEI